MPVSSLEEDKRQAPSPPYIDHIGLVNKIYIAMHKLDKIKGASKKVQELPFLFAQLGEACVYPIRRVN